MSAVTLVLGGTRSGKSAVAELIVSTLQAELDVPGPSGPLRRRSNMSGKHREPATLALSAQVPVTYVATAFVSDDPDHRSRIDAHRARRPDDWITVECPDPAGLPDALANSEGVVLVDSLGTWVSAHEALGSVDVVPVVNAAIARSFPTVLVSDEVGLAVHAPTAAGRAFVDAMGTVNQQVSAIATRAVLVVAGRPLELPQTPVWPQNGEPT